MFPAKHPSQNDTKRQGVLSNATPATLYPKQRVSKHSLLHRQTRLISFPHNRMRATSRLTALGKGAALCRVFMVHAARFRTDLGPGVRDLFFVGGW